MKNLVCLSSLVLLPALSAQGNFQDHVVWDFTVRFSQDFLRIDDDGDGMPALWVAAPGAATLYRFDEDGARIDIRGPTGLRFGHEFVVAPIFPGVGATAAVASVSGSTHSISFYLTDGTGHGSTVTVPASLGTVLDLDVGNFDGDPEREVSIVGSTGWGYYDGGSAAVVPVLTGIAPGTFSLRSLVRPAASGPDTLIVPTATTPIDVREYDVQGGSVRLDTLPPSETQVDSATWVDGDPVLSTSNGSVFQPAGKVWFFNRGRGAFDQAVTGQSDESFPRVSGGGPLIPDRVWFFVRKKSGGNETIEEQDGRLGVPHVVVQGPAGIGLDLADGGARDLFPGNTRHLLVRQALTSNFAAYQTDGPLDLRISGRGATSGNSLTIDAKLGLPGAGAAVYPLMSLAGSGSFQIPGIGAISLTPDTLTSASVALLGGSRQADPAGDTSFQFVVPHLPVSGLRLDVSFGYVGLKAGGGVALNQTGGFGYVYLQ
ncbi:MAG: hypothetical protein IPM29_29430 [Planctomycetes bacterium]|nr:hypothetical protein [Planctomycetota bacterium]